MIDLSKSFEFFDPHCVRQRCHIIGCGSVGGFVAELLTRFGVTDFAIYDFDTVEPKNVANQIFTQADVGMNKCDALLRIMSRVNPEVANTTRIYREGYTDQPLSGYVFLCVDNIELRKRIVSENRMNPSIKAMFDFRTRLTDSQHYAADWNKQSSINNLFRTMNFTDEEAEAETEVSACGVALCVAPTVRMIANIGVMNFVNFVRTGKLRHTVFVDVKRLTLDAFGGYRDASLEV